MKLQQTKIINMKDRFQAFMELTKFYELGSIEERKQINEEWDFDVEWDYPNQFHLALELDNQPKPAERIRSSLIFDAIETDCADIRQKLFGFCLIYHSAKVVGINVEKLFCDIASIAPKRSANEMLAFINRSSGNKSLEEFCIKKYRLIEEFFLK